jgi:hypothetical protein
MRSMDADDFYEDDEPVEKIMAAFERGEKGVTASPSRGINETVMVPGLRPILTERSSNRPNSLLASRGY